MQVVYPTTPANLFHVLRRQNKREFRKPLILFFSKSLLRHPLARSSLDEMIGDTSFQRYLPEAGDDSLVPPEQARRLLLCSGQVYHQLLKHREDNGIKDIHIARVEQLSPLPYDLITPDLDKYEKAEIYWVQEEVGSVVVPSHLVAPVFGHVTRPHSAPILPCAFVHR